MKNPFLQKTFMDRMGGSKRIRTKRSLVLRCLSGAFALLMLALGVEVFLEFNAFNTLYVETIRSQYSVIGKSLGRNLEKALFFGKNLRKFVGINTILEEARTDLIERIPKENSVGTDVGITVSVGVPEGVILYSSDETLVSTALPEQVRIDYHAASVHSLTSHDNTFQGNGYITLPIRDADGHWIATVIISFVQHRFYAVLNPVLRSTLLLVSGILSGSLLLLLMAFYWIIPADVETCKCLTLKFALIAFCGISISLVIFSVASTYTFKHYSLAVKMGKAHMLTGILQEDIENLLHLGVPIEHLTDVELLMEDMIAEFPELQSMTILDKQKTPLYIATKSHVFDVRYATTERFRRAYKSMPVLDPEYNLSRQVLKDGRIEGFVCVNLSKEHAVLSGIFQEELFSGTFKLVLVVTFVLLVFLPLLYTLVLHIKLRLTLSVFAVLILALGFNALLSLHSLEKLYVGSIASQYETLVKDLQRKIEKAVFFGKPIGKFVGMHRLLEETKHSAAKVHLYEMSSGTASEPVSMSDLSVSVALPDGSIVYSGEEMLVGTVLPENVRKGLEDSLKSVSATAGYIVHENSYTIPRAIRDAEGTWIASALITFQGENVRAFLKTVRSRHLKSISLILAGSILVLVFLLDLVTSDDAHFHQAPKLRIAFVMILVIGAAQVTFTSVNTYDFKKYFLQIHKQKAEILAAFIKDDIEFLLEEGVPLDKFTQMDVTLEDVLAISPELEHMAVLDAENQTLYRAPGNWPDAGSEDEAEAAYQFQFDLLKKHRKAGTLVTTLSKREISSKVRELLLDSATVLAISLLFFGELLALLFVYAERQLLDEERYAATHHFGAIRPAAFLFLFGSSLSASFLPLYMASLYEPIFHLSKDVVMGLPISVKMFSTGLSIVIAGVWLDRRGWQSPFLGGLALMALGLLYSWLAPNALHFIISRGIVGLGYGFSLMACQGFVVVHTDASDRAQGFTRLFAGVFAGSICGGAAGGMLAERIGFRPLFLLGGILVFSVIGYTLIFMKDFFSVQTPQKTKSQSAGINIREITSFLFHRNVLPLIVFASFPTALTMVGFLNYFSPIYLNQIGTSSSNIGRILMLHGICLIYLAPYAGKYIDASNSKKTYIFINCLLGSLAMILFYFLGGITASALAVLLLGLSDSFSDSRSSYILKLNITQQLGAGKALSIFSSVARIGQVLGPLTFAWLIVANGIHTGILYIGCAYLCLTLLFFLFTPNDRAFKSTEKSRT